MKEKEKLQAFKNFEMWYLTMGHHNPEALIQLQEIIPNDILNNLINAIASIINGDK